MQSPTLNTQMKKSLRGVAHHLDPVIAVSERGITDGIVEETRGERTQYIGKRHATRLMRDADCRGIVRG